MTCCSAGCTSQPSSTAAAKSPALAEVSGNVAGFVGKKVNWKGKQISMMPSMLADGTNEMRYVFSAEGGHFGFGNSKMTETSEVRLLSGTAFDRKERRISGMIAGEMEYRDEKGAVSKIPLLTDVTVDVVKD